MFLIFIGLYVAFNYRTQIFNYDRIWHWNFLALVGCMWTALISMLDESTSEHIAYVILLFLGWGVIRIVGIVI